MTKNQIDYMRLKETERNNQAVEAEVQRHNKKSEELSEWATAISWQIHVNEMQLERARLAETQRSNIARETQTAIYNAQTIAETQRANLAREAEIMRSNLANERETLRKNLANEELTRQSIAVDISRVQAQREATQAQIYATNMNYAIRSLEMSETKRHNVANEVEQRTHNRETELQQYIQLNINQQNADTASRNADTQSRLASNTIRATGETVRHNLETEEIQRKGLAIDLISGLARSLR